MKKFLRVVCMVLVLSMLLTPLCFAEENYDTLADWDLKVKVPEGKTAVLKGNQYYIYGQRAGEIPYVMIMAYHYESEEKFIADFTASMQRSYADLTVTKEAERTEIGDKAGWEIDFGYTVSGYQVADRRIIMKVGEWVYMFASKEIAELNRTLGTMLEDVVADCEFLSENGSALEALEEEEIEFSPAYLYCLNNGTPKYWIDLTGEMANTIVLHCFFRSGDPSFYESVYYLDLDSADVGSGRVEVYQVSDERGYDVSDWFKSLTLVFKGKQLTMTVKRDEKTLAGGAEDNILSGSYWFEPSVRLLPENEVSEPAGVTIDQVTGGPVGNDRLETNIPGVFACGNVLHVHDLVDHVSREAIQAGISAGRFVRGITSVSGHQVVIRGGRGVRYTVPQTVDLATMSAQVEVSFRVSDQFRDAYLACYVDGVRIAHKKKQIMTPGEMESFILRRDRLNDRTRRVEFCGEDA